MSDMLLLYFCIMGTACCAFAFHAWCRHRRFKVLTWASERLRSFRQQIQAQRKTLLQQEAWHPGDPKTAFLREHLNRQIKAHNRIVDKINEEARKP